MSRFAFAFYATMWREGLIWPLQVCLHSLDAHGGAAAEYPRYLVYSGEVTPEVRDFCESHRVILQWERRLSHRTACANKILMCRVPAHEVVCLADTDLIFLGDPTPAFEQAAAGVVLSRTDLTSPLWPWPSLPPSWQEYLRHRVGERIWRGQYRRFSTAASPDVDSLPDCGNGFPVPYFNSGVNFVPGGHLQPLGQAWWGVCRTLLRDYRLRRPYARFFTPYFLDQIGYPLALHRGGIPWQILDVAYNFIPSVEAPAAELQTLASGRVVVAHAVSPIRDWLDPDKVVDCPDLLQPLLRRVREVVAEIPADRALRGRLPLL